MRLRKLDEKRISYVSVCWQQFLQLSPYRLYCRHCFDEMMNVSLSVN